MSNYAIVCFNAKICWMDSIATVEEAIEYRKAAKKEYPDSKWFIVAVIDGEFFL